MKTFKHISIIFSLFFFQKINAQDYQFLSGIAGKNGSAGILVNKDSMVFWPIGNASNYSDFYFNVLS